MRAAVAAAMEGGRTRAQVVAARPIRRWADAWNQNEASETNFVETLYVSLGGR